MLLSDKTLRKYIDEGVIGLTPLDEQQIQPASIDLRLGTTFATFLPNVPVIELDQPIQYKYFETNTVVIPAKGFLLATTKEYVLLPGDITAFVEGRSSIGRAGLFIHNAGLIDAGFEGEITLELFNAGSIPIRIKAGQRICQMTFYQMDQASEESYDGKYQGQRGATGSYVHQDYENSQK
jgi:dCTP deaminase